MMTPDERTLLNDFLRDLEQSRGGFKDAEAERLIIDALRANPDGAYVLVQHAILADQALHVAQARIADLERQVASNTSFLGNRQAPPQTAVPPSSGYGQQQAYGQSQAYVPNPGYGQQTYAPPPQPQGGLFSFGGGLGSFLRSAGTTAAGVAGGEMLFSGLSGLFGGHRGGGFWGGGGGGYGGGYGYGGPPEVENVTINEYGDDSGSLADDDYDDGDWSGDDN